MLGRGARFRCAWCGGRRAFFTGWFDKQDQCRTCGIGWRRGYEGFELGAMAINTTLMVGLLILGGGIGIVAMWPDVDSVVMLGVLALAALVLPVVLYPVSYTLWQAVDLAMRPPSADDPGVPPPRR